MADANFVVKKGLNVQDGDISIKGSNKELRFYEGSNYVGFEAPALSADKIWVLPAADGSTGQLLKTDGSGNLGWVNGGASVIGGLTDVTMDITNYTDGILIQTNSDGSAPTTGTLNAADGNVGIGKDVLSAITSADANVVIGKNAGPAITSGGFNVLLGENAGSQISTGYSNIAIGRGANRYGNGNENIALGTSSMMNADLTGIQNICIGYSAGNNITTGDYNVVLGNADVASATGNHQLSISSNDASSPVTWITGDSSGVVNIPGSLTVAGSAVGGASLSNDANNRIVTADGSGGINGEANLTFDGSTLALAGKQTITVADTVSEAFKVTITDTDSTDDSTPFVVDGDGRVGIGTASPVSGFALTLNGDGSSYEGLAFQVGGSTKFKQTTDSTAMYFDSAINSGNINFRVKDSGSNLRPALGIEGSNYSVAVGYNGTSGSSLNPKNTFQVNVGTENGVQDNDDGILLLNSDLSIADGDKIGGIGFATRDGNIPSVTTEAAAAIVAYAAEDHSTGDKGGNLAFLTSAIDDDDDTASNERMRITSEGKVIIGDTPNFTTQHDSISKFTIQGTDAGMLIEKHDDGASGGPTLALYRYSASVADSDLIGQVNFRGEGSTGNPSTYMSLRTEIEDTTEGSKDGKLIVRGLKANSQTDFMSVGSTGVEFEGGAKVGVVTDVTIGSGTSGTTTGFRLGANQEAGMVAGEVSSQSTANDGYIELMNMDLDSLTGSSGLQTIELTVQIEDETNEEVESFKALVQASEKTVLGTTARAVNFTEWAILFDGAARIGTLAADYDSSDDTIRIRYQNKQGSTATLTATFYAITMQNNT